MFKILLTSLFILVLTGCSGQEKKEAKTTQTEVDEMAKAIQAVETPKATATTKKEEEKQASKNRSNIYTLKTLEGKELHVDETDGGLVIQEYKGKIVYLLFFGYRCPPCLAEIPHIVALEKKKHPDLEIVAVEVQGLPEEDLKDFVKDKGINYTTLADKPNYDFVSYVANRAKWGGSIPFLVVFDKQGDVALVHVGGMSAEEFNTIYDNLSKEQPKVEKK